MVFNPKSKIVEIVRFLGNWVMLDIKCVRPILTLPSASFLNPMQTNYCSHGLWTSEITTFSTLCTTIMLSALILWLDAVFDRPKHIGTYMKKSPKDIKQERQEQNGDLFACLALLCLPGLKEWNNQMHSTADDTLRSGTNLTNPYPKILYHK